MQQQAKVFVSGATGYVAGHIIECLLSRGYQVIGSVRSLQNQKKIEHLQKFKNSQNLTFVEADLSNPIQKWQEIIKGSDLVIHSASPFPLSDPKNADELIKPAVQGTEGVVQATINLGIKKLVLTSSVVAIYPGNYKQNLSGNDWSLPSESNAYEASKHYAEKKAWELIEKQNTTKMTVINPGFIQGPAHTNQNSFTSHQFLKDLLTGKIPVNFKIMFPWADVREVAIAHVNALEREQSNGKRYPIVSQTGWLSEMSSEINKHFGQFGYKAPSSEIGSCLMTMIGWFDKDVKSFKRFYNKSFSFDNSDAKNDLGIVFRSAKESVFDSIYDLIQKGQLPNKLKKDHVKTHQTQVFPEGYQY